METKSTTQVASLAKNECATTAPSTGREASASAERRWESFPQPAGWSLYWDNEGLAWADAPHETPQPAAPDADGQG